MSTPKDKYNQEFKSVADKLNLHSFKDLFEIETGYEFNRARQAPCPFDNCASGKSGKRGSDGAFTYYPTSNIGKCHSCGQAAGNVKLLQILHGYTYPELIHYAAQKYFSTTLDDPGINVKVKQSKKKLSEYKKPTKKELLAEDAKRWKAFTYIRDLVLKNEKKEAKEYLISRAEDPEFLPKDSFYQLNEYKDKPAGVVFFDSEKRFLNQRYFKVEEGSNKQFSFGELKNSVYDHCFIPEAEKVFLTEGVINARSIFSVKQSSIALFATTNYIDDIPKFSKYLEGKNVVIAFDFDQNFAGQKAAIKQSYFIINNFNVQSVSILVFPEDEDANDLLQKKELINWIENKFNYVFPSKSQLKEMSEEIKKNYKGYQPVLKPDNYYNRPAANKKQEPDGYFTFKKAEKIPDKTVDRFRGFKDVCDKTFEAAGLIPLEEYTIISKGTAHIHKSVAENPIFIIEDSQKIIRPFAQKPYKVIESYDGELYHHGMAQIVKAYEINREQSDSDQSNLQRATIVYNFIDFINLTAIDEYPLFINERLGYDLRKELLGYAKEIIQTPAKTSKERKLANESAKNNIELRSYELVNGYRSVSDYLSSLDEDKLYKYRYNLNTALPLKFWSFIIEGKKHIFNLNVIILRNFLTKFGYYTYQSEFGNQDYMYINIKGRIVKKIDKDIFPRHIKIFIDTYLKESGKSVDIRNKISVSNRFSEQNMSGLQEIKLDFDNSGVNFQNWFFSDGTMWTATKDGIKKRSQSSLRKYVWEEELLNYPSEITVPPFIISFSEKYLNADKSEKYKIKESEKYDIDIKDRSNYFLQYLFATSYCYFEKAETKGYFLKPTDFWKEFPEDLFTEDEIKEMKLHLINKITWLGYYMKDFREADHDYGLAILDAIEDLPGNRRRGAAGGGKSLITKGIREIKRTHIIKAEREDFAEYNHRYENYNGERIIVCDDMHLKSKIGNMLTDFSDGINKNEKHKRVIPIPFHRSPKIIITRNYIDDEGERVDRRLGRMFVFPFFHDNKSGRFKQRRKPADWFGRMLYKNDTHEDKKGLVNFFAHAYVANRNFGEISPPMMDMEKFRLGKRIGEPLIDFLDTLFENEYDFGFVDRVFLYNKFKEDKRMEMNQYERTRVYNTSQKFKVLIADYCTLREYTFNPDEFITDKEKGRIKRQSAEQLDSTGQKKNTEHFYIAPKERFFEDLDKFKSGEDFSDVEDLEEGTQDTLQF